LYDLSLMTVPEMFFIGPRRRELSATLTGLVVEIGAGTGLSLRHYPSSTRVIATEFDPVSLPRLAMRARMAPATVLVSCADAQALPFPDATFDGLACHLALCTIRNPRAALAEVRRVLKPGAPARFLEHVRGESRLQAKVQDSLAPAWTKLAAGCRLNQDTEALIEASGLRIEKVIRKGGLLLPMRLVWATAPL
jgi:ubiquinone/menaquinone biosynthesis C-methylase UbiE